MNGHDITEHVRLLSHRRYVEVIERRPDLIARASEILVDEISRSGGTLGQRLWAKVLQQPWNEIRRRMLEDPRVVFSGRIARSPHS